MKCTLPESGNSPAAKLNRANQPKLALLGIIFEDLEIHIEAIEQLKPVTYHYPEKSIRLIPFRCKILSGKIKLTEHEAYKWVSKSEMKLMDWAAADVEIIEVNGLKG